jgi:hypothetical protein
LFSSLPSKNVKIRIHESKILPVVLYECETWYLILREECQFKVSENVVLRRTLRPKTEVTGQKKLHNDKLHTSYSSPNTYYDQINSEMIRGHSTHWGDEKCIQNFSVGKLEEKKQLGRPMHRREGIKVHLKKK